MRKFIFVAVFVCSLCCVAADAEITMNVAPYARIGFGDTRYEIFILGYDSDSSLFSGGSRLIYPIDDVQTGIRFNLSVMEKGNRAWTAEARIGTAVSNPHSRMSDDDWENIQNVEVLWSHTLSDVDGSASSAGLEVTRLLSAGHSAELGVLVGIQYQRIMQKMISLYGYQYWDADTNGQLEVYLASDRELALTYEIRYVRPRLGLVSRWQAGPFGTEIKAALSPMLSVKDIDDHVRRGFQIRTDGRGVGVGCSVALSYEAQSFGARPFVTLSGDFFGADLNTVGTRDYYRDYEKEGIHRGDRFSESHRIRTRQYGIELAVGMKL